MTTTRIAPAFDRAATPTRVMTASEMMMARAVGSVITKKHPACIAMRALHARALTEHQRYILEHESAQLRQCVRDLAAVLPKEVVAIVERGA